MADSIRPISDTRSFELTAPKRPFAYAPIPPKVAPQVWAHAGGDPAWCADPHPHLTIIFEFTGSLPEPAHFKAEGSTPMPPLALPKTGVEVKVRKPSGGHAGY